MNQSVYVIQSDAGPIKIGVSAKPAARLADLVKHQPFGASLVYTHTPEIVDARLVEAAAHTLLSCKRHRGEWFNVDQSEAIEAIKEAERCVSGPKDVAVRRSISDWQRYAKDTGLSQKMLAKLLGVAENTVSLQLRGKWQSGTPQYVKTVIRMWGLLSPEAREKILQEIGED